ncbi:MAG: hypothetical protein PHO64_07305 [Thiomonas sp.]|nr:hypothetical protein [Thiomonas sp.]
MHTTHSPATFHPDHGPTFFEAMQGQIHALAAQLRALYQPDPLRQMQRRHARDLSALQQQFGDAVQVAAHRPTPAPARR